MAARLILGIESSCDETSAAVLRNGNEVLANVVASQWIHSDYGGVVPELASREHLRNIVPVVTEALTRAGVSVAELDAISVTEGPGLAGALLVGVTFAKALALAADKPLIAVNHLEGHIHAVIMHAGDTISGRSPLLALVVSGGHTHLYLAEREGDAWRYRNVGKTLDDAAGEAYDKVAKLLGLPYPGGPWMDALAVLGNPNAVPFTFAQLKTKPRLAPKLREQAIDTSAIPRAAANHAQDALRFDFSFSGIKTAVRRYTETHNLAASIAAREQALRAAGLHHARPSHRPSLDAVREHFDNETIDLIASFQHAVVHYLLKRTFDAAAAIGAQGILISGGVSANSHLRRCALAIGAKHGLPVLFPTIALATDNAAMIAAAAYPKLLGGAFAAETLEPTAQLRLG